MNKKILHISIFAIAVLINMHVFTDVFGDTAIPKVKLYGTSTYWADSTNYQTTNKSVYIHDSLKVGKDLYVGVKGGSIYMDTTRGVKMYVEESSFYVVNDKPGSVYIMATSTGGNVFLRSDQAGQEYLIGTGSTSYTWNKRQGGFEVQIMKLDTATGLILNQGNIQLTGGTQQIKLPSDTASDYDGNNSITLNRQSGILTTKALTTASLATYDLTLVNSLGVANSKVMFSIVYAGGTNTISPLMALHTVYSGGNWILTIYNASGSSLNGTVQIRYVIFN